jgi:hypothetical protein
MRVPQLLDLYQQLRRSKLAVAGIRTGSSAHAREVAVQPAGGEGAAHVGCTAGAKSATGDADAAQLFSQIMSKGSYVSKVQSDLAEYGPALDKLAATVAAFQPVDMDAVMCFVHQAQKQVLDLLYDETAVLKCITDWPAAKWEALWEASVMHKQLTALRLQCDSCSAKQRAILENTPDAVRPSSSSGGGGGGKGPSRVTQLAAAAAAAQQTYAAVSSKLDGFQRQESGLEKRLRAQGVPWNGPQLVAAVKEAAVQLGVVFVDASLALLRESEQLLLQTQQQLSGSSGGEGSPVGGSLWGCAVREQKQLQKLEQQLQRQTRQHEQRRRQQLEDAVTFLFKLHQFSGGFDDQGVEAFCGLAEEFQKQQAAPAAAPAVTVA